MSDYIGKKCPFCNAEFTEKDNVVFCSVCAMPHHLECWQENQGCTTFGCTGSIERIIENSKPEKQEIKNTPAQKEISEKDAPETEQIRIHENRFETVKEENERVFFPDLKIVCNSYCILRDNVNIGDLFARFSFQHYSDRKINAILADIEGSDMWGNVTETLTGVQFLDLHASRTTVFGQTAPVKLTNPNTRKITLTLKGIIFDDATALNMSAVPEKLKTVEELSEGICDDSLLEYYKHMTSGKARYKPFSQNNLRFCVCGSYLSDLENICPVCKTDFALSEKLLDLSFLSDELRKYKQEKEEKARKKKEEAEAAQKRIQEAELEFNYNNLCKKTENANSADEYRELAGDFEKLGDYADAKDKSAFCIDKADDIVDKRKKKRRKIVKIVVSSIASVALVLSSIFFFIPLARYGIASLNLKKGNYNKAYTTFVALDDFLDSRTMVQETRYQNATELMNSKKYAEAYKIFITLNKYKDSNTLSDKCWVEDTYLKGVAFFESEKYSEAATNFDKISAKKTEAKEYAKKSHYLAAKALIAKNDFTDALPHLLKVGTGYEESTALTNECYYQCGLSLFNKKNYEKAYEYLTKVKNYKDIPSKYNEICYQYGLVLLNKKEWKNAVTIFSTLGSYSNSKEKLNAAKYGYVKENFSSTNTITYSYLKDLKAADYKDSASIYKSLYAWQVSLIVNNSEYNETRDMSSISKYDTVYVHVRLTGGPPNGEVKLGYSYKWPGNSKKYDSWDFTLEAGDTAYFWTWLTAPYYGNTGKMYFTVYEKGTGTVLASETVYITN